MACFDIRKLDSLQREQDISHRRGFHDPLDGDCQGGLSIVPRPWRLFDGATTRGGVGSAINF